MLIVTITGKSGAGKDTIAEYLSKTHGWNIIRSYTTRLMRTGEVNGREHIFVKDAPTSIESCFAYTKYGKHEYWTKWGQFLKNDVNIYIVDEKGLNDVISQSKKYHFKMFRIAVWTGEKARLRRGVSEQRMDRDKTERDITDVAMAYNAIIKNGSDLESLYRKLDVLAEKIKRAYEENIDEKSKMENNET